jgi:hypothetical protein
VRFPRHLIRPAAALLAVASSAALAVAVPAQQSGEPAVVATPRANCGPGDRPEPSIQGRVPREEVDSGRADRGYFCNLVPIGQSGSTGGYRVHRYVDKSGRECAYYDTTLLFPTNAFSLSAEPTGVAVLDMSDPRKPVRTTTLLSPAMQTPHESLNISVQRGVLAAVLGNPTQYPGGIDVYDIKEDCRNPELMSAAFPASPFGHESGISPDGKTFYPTSPGGTFAAVDISNPRLPRTLFTSDRRVHGMSVSDDGRRGYLAASKGLEIVDLSEIQDRKPNPQVREISRLTWSNVTIPQYTTPLTINGKAYLMEVDEFATGENGSGVAGNGPRVGAARIIDISNERAPRVVSNIRLSVHQPENRAAIAGDYGARSPIQGYAAHYCNVPRRREPGILACSMINSGLRVFDISDPLRPKEVAYYVAPPSTVSASGSSTIDERANFAMSQPDFAPERNEVWYSDGTSGFHVLKLDPEIVAAAQSRNCLARRSPIGPRNIGRVRLGYTRRTLRRIGVAPTRKTRRSYRYCVKRSRGIVSAVFNRRGRVALVTSTASTHRLRRTGRGVSLRVLKRRFPRARRISRTVLRAGPTSRRIFVVRRGKVRFAAVADRGLLRRPAVLRRYVRAATG